MAGGSEENGGHPGPTPDRLAALARAGWGAAAGFAVVLAGIGLAVAATGPTESRVQGQLLESNYLKDFLTERWQERYERTGYALLCAACPLAALAAVRRLRAPGWVAAASAAAAIPAGAWAAAGVFADQPTLTRLPLLFAALAPPLAWGLGRRPEEAHAEVPAPAGPPRAATALLGVPLAAVLVVLLWPFNLTTAGSYCQDQAHVASYIVAPAVYYHAPGVAPALDFESHYGIGHAYAFSFFCGGGLLKTMTAYVAFLVVVTILYFLSAYAVLTDWFGRPVPALLATLVLVAASFDGITLGLPSNWPVRHPFVFAFLFAAVRGAATDRAGLRWAAAAGAVAGLSVFWQTDTGILTAVAGTAFLGGSWWFRGTPVCRLPVFATAGVATFFGLCAACFGPRTLSPEFVRRLLEPVLLYAGGLGNELVCWKAGWWYLYDLAAPGLALATVGLALARRDAGAADHPLRYAMLASILGLGLLFKWVNRSIDVVWTLNAGPVLAVCCWWAWVAWSSAASRLGWRPCASPVRTAILLAGMAAVAAQLSEFDRKWADPAHHGGSSSPLVRMRKNLKGYPGLFTRWRSPTQPDRFPSPVAADKVAFVRDRTAPGERVAMISGMDWMYLADADRSPGFHWVPIGMVHSPQLLARCAEDLRNYDKVFVEYGAPEWLKELNPKVYEALVPAIEKDFEIVEWYGNSWRVYQRRRAAAR